MDRLLSLEPSNEVAIRIERGQRCYGEITLRNVMYTMPVAFRLIPTNRNRYTVRPQSGVIAPLHTVKLEITYLLPLNSSLPETIPVSADTFLLDSVVVPGAADKTFDAVPNDWFAARKKQVFTHSGIRVFFVGSAVLTRLVSEGCMEQVRDVLERSDPEWRAADSVDSLGRTVLHLAISRCRADLVQLLLEFNPDVEARSRGAGRTPLESAAAAGEELIVELLLARGASTEKSSSSSTSWGPLHYAASAGHAGVTNLLLRKRADPNSSTADGLTPLHLAVAERRKDCVRTLLAGGALAEVRGGPDGNTALHVAAAAGDEQLVRLLVINGGGGLREVRNYVGRTAYDDAVDGGHGKLFDILKLADGLAATARKGDARAVARMIERGAAVNGRDGNGWTALMRAGFKGRADVMKVLLEKGAEVDARDEEGHTALHCAVEAGQAEVVEMLVKRGADVEARTGKGKTAMQIAGSLGYVGIMRILLQGGANKKGAPVFGISATDSLTILSSGKRQIKMMQGKVRGRDAHEKEVRKKGSRLSSGGDGAARGMFKGRLDREGMVVASH